jgi:hypothetical protein
LRGRSALPDPGRESSFEIKAVGIGNLVDTISRFQGSDLHIVKRHGSTPFKKVLTDTNHERSN